MQKAYCEHAKGRVMVRDAIGKGERGGGQREVRADFEKPHRKKLRAKVKSRRKSCPSKGRPEVPQGQFIPRRGGVGKRKLQS